MPLQSPLQAVFRPKPAVLSGNSCRRPQHSRDKIHIGKENAQKVVMTSAAAGRYHPTVQGSYAEQCSILWKSQPKGCHKRRTSCSEPAYRRAHHSSDLLHGRHPEACVMTSAAGGRYQPTLPKVAAGNLLNGEVASLLSAAEFGSILSIAGLDAARAAHVQQSKASSCRGSTMPAPVRPISAQRPDLPNTRNTAPVKPAYEAAAQFSRRPSKEQLKACNRLSQPMSSKPPRVRALERANTAPPELPTFNLASSRVPPGGRVPRSVWQTSEEAPKKLQAQRDRLFPSQSSANQDSPRHEMRRPLRPKQVPELRIVSDLSGTGTTRLRSHLSEATVLWRGAPRFSRTTSKTHWSVKMEP